MTTLVIKKFQILQSQANPKTRRSTRTAITELYTLIAYVPYYWIPHWCTVVVAFVIKSFNSAKGHSLPCFIKRFLSPNINQWLMSLLKLLPYRKKVATFFIEIKFQFVSQKSSSTFFTTSKKVKTSRMSSSIMS